MAIAVAALKESKWRDSMELERVWRAAGREVDGRERGWETDSEGSVD
jgi:hypothetical protein